MATSPEHEQEIARLQGRLGDRLARLEALDPAAQEYDPAADDVLAAAQELISFEERVPNLVDEQPRRITLIVLRGCGAVTMVIAAVMALGVVPGGRAWWWLPVAVVLAVAGALLLTTRVRRDLAGHLRQRPPGALILTGGLCAGLGELGVLTVVLVAAAAILVAVGLTLDLARPGVQVRDLASGEPLDLDLDQRPLTAESTGDISGAHPGER